MKKLFYALLVFFAAPLAFADKEAQVPYTWEKDTLYTLDKLQENVIVQLPVLKLKAENLGKIYFTRGHLQADFINPEQTKSWEQKILPPATSQYKAVASEKNRDQSLAPYRRYGLIDPPNVYWGNMTFDYPFIVYGNTALILLSSIPLKQWELKPPHEGDASFKVEACALQSLRKGEILISYTSKTKINQQDSRQLALFNEKTGDITDIAKIDGCTPPDLLHVFWLNDRHIAFTFLGRQIADWTIYEIPSGQKCGGGCSLRNQETENVISQFYIANGCLLAKAVRKERGVLLLWQENGKEKRRIIKLDKKL